MDLFSGLHKLFHYKLTETLVLRRKKKIKIKTNPLTSGIKRAGPNPASALSKSSHDPNSPGTALPGSPRPYTGHWIPNSHHTSGVFPLETIKPWKAAVPCWHREPAASGEPPPAGFSSQHRAKQLLSSLHSWRLLDPTNGEKKGENGAGTQGGRHGQGIPIHLAWLPDDSWKCSHQPPPGCDLIP